MPIIQSGPPSFKIASGHLAAPIGSARVLQNFSTCPERQGCTPRRRAHRLGGPAGDWEADTRLGGCVCLDEGFYLHQQRPAGSAPRSRPPQSRDRSSGPMQPAAGISALSTETICGPKLRPPRCPSPRSRHGDSHHRRSTAVEVGFEPTEDLRLHTLSSTAHHRSPASVSVRGLREHHQATTGERWRTAVNETKTETRRGLLLPWRPRRWMGLIVVGAVVTSRGSDSCCVRCRLAPIA